LRLIRGGGGAGVGLLNDETRKPGEGIHSRFLGFLIRLMAVVAGNQLERHSVNQGRLSPEEQWLLIEAQRLKFEEEGD
jgi:hypothetical protein